QLGDTSTNYQILPGDRIFVPNKGLLEMICPKKQECVPCGRPQTPCPPPPGDCTHPVHLLQSPAAPFLAPDPNPLPSPRTTAQPSTRQRADPADRSPSPAPEKEPAGPSPREGSKEGADPR